MLSISEIMLSNGRKADALIICVRYFCKTSTKPVNISTWNLTSPSLATASSDPLSYFTIREGHAEIAVDLIMHAVKLEGLTDGTRAAVIHRSLSSAKADTAIPTELWALQIALWRIGTLRISCLYSYRIIKIIRVLHTLFYERRRPFYYAVYGNRMCTTKLILVTVILHR